MLFFMNSTDSLIFDFSKDSNLDSWKIVNDVVMGGRSYGSFRLNRKGNAFFEGEISLENNGGFSSVRHQMKAKDISKFSKVTIRLKGDGKKYQFRIKKNKKDYHSYITTFQTSKDWKTITINIRDMYPTFRGRKLNMDNLIADKIEEIAFLIGNKKAEKFRLEIDVISLK